GNVEWQREFPHEAKRRLSFQQLCCGCLGHHQAGLWPAPHMRTPSMAPAAITEIANPRDATTIATPSHYCVYWRSFVFTRMGEQRGVPGINRACNPLKKCGNAKTHIPEPPQLQCAVIAATPPPPANQRALQRIHRRAAPVKERSLPGPRVIR